MYSIPAPVIKTILNHCDLPTAIIMARVTKRCSNIFRHYREEILERCEYVNVPNMFRYCSDEFIIRMSKHEFFYNYEAQYYCYQKRYYLHIKLGYGKLNQYIKNKTLLREIYEKNDYNDVISVTCHKLHAAKIGIDLDIPYPNTSNGLHAALLLQNKPMIEKLQQYGNFYVYCVTGNYHLADNYAVELPHMCINFSNDPLATFNYIEKRGYTFVDHEYFVIDCYEVHKLVMPRITQLPEYIFIQCFNYDSLMLICNKLLEFSTIDDIYQYFEYRNINFTKYLLQKYNHLIEKFKLTLMDSIVINLLDFLDNEKVMHYACENNCYDIIRALVHCNGHEWVQQFDHPFIKKYYS